MAKVSDMLTFLRKREGISQQELANKLGLTRSAIGMYETGRREPDLETLEAFADYYNVDMNTLTGLYDAAKDAIYLRQFNELSVEQKNRAIAYAQSLPKNVIPLPPMNQVPLVGRIACGVPILAEENIEEYVDLPRHIRADFALMCHGESMINIGIHSGDIVYIRHQEEVENGQVAAVMIGDEEATLKRFYHNGNVVQLIAENSAVPPMVFVGEDTAQIHVLGLAVAYTHAIE